MNNSKPSAEPPPPQYPFGTVPLAEATRPYALHPDVLWLRFGLPFALNHLNLWLLRDEIGGRAGWTVVDCCIYSEENKTLWEQVFAAPALEGLPILRVIITHMHPDHIGLADWLCQRWSVPMYISATDFNAAHIASQSTTGFGGDRAAQFFWQHGLQDATAVAKIRARATYYPTLVPSVPRQFNRLLDGQTLSIGGRHWRCISGYGHAPEHMALHCSALNMLISGDMLLPRISTNISVYDVEPEANPLPLFLDSIDKFTALPTQTCVLPSHGLPFVGIHDRVASLHLHHTERLHAVQAACAEPVTAFAVMKVLFARELDLHQTTFAMGETIAHLHALMHSGVLRRSQDAQGVYRFANVD